MANLYVCSSVNVIDIYQGSDYEDTITVTYADGTPYNLSNCTFKSQLRVSDGTFAADFECTAPAPATGVIYRHIPAEDTAVLTPRVVHVWGVKVTDVDGEVLPEIQGGANVIAGVVE